MTVYDFDNTIYDGESALDIFKYYFKKDPIGIFKILPKFLEGYRRYKKGEIDADTVVDEYGDMLVTYCLRLGDIDKDVQDFWDKHEKKIKPLYFDLQKDDDVIVSASPEIALSEICKRIGIKHYIGSVFDPKTGKVSRVCYKQKKIDAFYEVYGERRIDTFYTDSMSDKPMMDISDNVFLVKGEKITKIKENNKWLIETN